MYGATIQMYLLFDLILAKTTVLRLRVFIFSPAMKWACTHMLYFLNSPPPPPSPYAACNSGTWHQAFGAGSLSSLGSPPRHQQAGHANANGGSSQIIKKGFG